MALPRRQVPQDWASQLLNISLGKRVDIEADQWLLGPIGEIGGISDRFIENLAKSHNWHIRRDRPNVGLMDHFDIFTNLEVAIRQEVIDFYTQTSNYHLDVWTEWKQAVFKAGGHLIHKLFSKRIHQLNIPQSSLDTALGMKSEIITLEDAGAKIFHRVWFRRLVKTGEVVYSGIYSTCFLPDGTPCIKVIFPLPQGSATVILKVSTDESGNLILTSKGKRYGDPGFYFIVEDHKGQLYKHFLPSFHERIYVYVDKNQTLRADHTMSLRNATVYELHYRMQKIF